MLKIDQKEYLRKYLSGDKKKKKKKKDVPKTSRVKIIDDDVSTTKNHLNDDDEIILTGEDAPQIVGIIDDRPPELKTIEDFRSSGKWKSVSRNDTKETEKASKKTDDSSKYLSDFSPKRSSKDFSERLRTEKRKNSDFSPKRRSKSPKLPSMESEEKNSHKANRRSTDDDFSPPRRRHKTPDFSLKYSTKHKQKRRDSDDFSPPRKVVKEKEKVKKVTRNSDDDFSPKRKDNDYSPPRKTDRREKFKTDKNVEKRKSRWENSRDADTRRSKKSKSPEIPPRRRRSNSSDLSPKRRNKRDRSSSVSRSSRRDVNDGKTRNANESSRKAKRTLDGKRAGLQDAKMLKKETELFRKKEDELFKNMSAEMSGRDADIMVRDRRIKTITEIKKEQQREKEKEEKEREKQEAYDRWGMGLKQIEDYKKQKADELHEKSKPLARYSNDADLDEMLRNQERDGDPMLAYIREKKQEKNKKSGGSAIPTYKGPFPENRFNIKPGYRWDGVDRSNGYEKKWFDIQNQKKALREEAYKYSVEDM